jgi:hypothetical protein
MWNTKSAISGLFKIQKNGVWEATEKPAGTNSLETVAAISHVS